MAVTGSVVPAQETSPRRVRTRLRRWLRRILISLAALLLAGIAGIIALFLIYPLPANLNAYVPAPSTRIYDRQGRLLYEVVGPGGKRATVPLSTIPLALRDATIAAEDSSFYHNPGIDPVAIVRSLFLDARLGSPAYGGSTITQQLVRTILLSPAERTQRSLPRKLHEASLALQLTLRDSKDQVLALYLNNVYYGNLAYGVEAASEGYFDRPVASLDLAQCALLAGIPQGPSLFNPLINPDQARGRRHEVLQLMLDHGYITAVQEKQADAEALDLAAPGSNIQAPHFVFYVMDQLEQQYGEAAVEQGGLQVTTTLDLNLQQEAESAVRFHVAQLSKDHLVHDGALVSMDPNTGQILAMVGSVNYSDQAIDGAVNVAVAGRQPGSAIKPFTYAAAFSGNYTPATVVDDVATSFPTKEGIPFVPQNYDLQFHGPVTLRTALANSYNIPAVKVLAHVGIPAMLNMAHAAGITTMNDARRYGLALTLGGGEVRLLDLTDAYGTFPTGGVHHDPVSILRVVAGSGKVLQEWQPSPGSRAMSPQVAYLLTSILSDNTARMPEFGADSPLLLDRPAAAKTGTTSDFHDNWTVGYTPYLVTGVWVGNADNTAMRNVSGIAGAAPIWHDFMEAALQGDPLHDFTQPPGLVHETICPLTGLSPTAACPQRFNEVFIAGAQPRADSKAPAIAPSVTLTQPAAGTRFQINISVPLAYQQTPVDVRGHGVTAGSVRLLVDGRVAHRFSGLGGEWFWPLSPGTHRLQVIGTDARGQPVRSSISTVQVLKAQSPL